MQKKQHNERFERAFKKMSINLKMKDGSTLKFWRSSGGEGFVILDNMEKPFRGFGIYETLYNQFRLF
jgi:hypothetical protein